MSTNRPMRARVFESRPSPRIGEIWLVAVDGNPRPFLVVESDAPTCAGWVFHVPRQDQDSSFLRAQGHGAEARRHPCYCVVPADQLTPVSKGRPS